MRKWQGTQFRPQDSSCLVRSRDKCHLASVSYGVPIGVGVRMPRLPAIYTRKKRWRIEAQATPAGKEEHAST